jgi:hypothetical protein
MTEPADRRLAGYCLRRAIADVESWLALVEQGQLASLAPLGQTFVYQLRTQGRLADKAFAVDELYKLYYRRAGGMDAPPRRDAGLIPLANPRWNAGVISDPYPSRILLYYRPESS